jgi:fatty acid desaturase
MGTYQRPSFAEGGDIQQGKTLWIQLRNELKSAGCFETAPVQQILHMVVVVALYAGAYLMLLTQPGIGTRVASVVLLAFISVQAGYIAHEAGHRAITRKRWLTNIIGQFFNTFLTALCYAHFQKIHLCHHSHCNERERDIDMQSDIFSLYPEAKLRNTSRVGRLITRYQAYLIWPLVSLQGFSLKVDSIKTLRRNPRKTRADQVVLGMHLLLWFGLPVYVLGWADATINYALMTWFIGPYLGSAFLVNHIGTHVVDPGEKMPGLVQKLITTRNLGDSRLEDIYFGGMNNHIEHHLFPSIPSVRLRKARLIIKAFCMQHGLGYREMNWRNAAGEVFTYLNRIGRVAA